MARIQCEFCGNPINIGMPGRPRRDIPLNVILSTLGRSRTTTQAAESLGMSRGFIRNRLREAGAGQPLDYLKGTV